MLAILPALDAAFEAREPLRDIAQPSLDGSQASIQAGNLAPEEAADREYGKGVEQYVHTHNVDEGSRYRQPRGVARGPQRMTSRGSPDYSWSRNPP